MDGDINKGNGGNILSEYRGQHLGPSLYFSEISQHKILTKEEEFELFKKIRGGDKKAYHTVVQKNLRLVVQIALKYNSQEFGLMDRISEGNLGLIHAIEKFDETKGFRFSTYAHWWIKQSIEKGIMNQGRSVRLPAHVIRLLSRYSKAGMRLTNADKVQSVENIASDMGCDSNHLHNILSNCENVIHMDQKRDDNDTSMLDVIKDNSCLDGQTELLHHDFEASLLNILRTMPPYEHFIVIRRLGLIENMRNTLSEVSEITGFSIEQVRSREKKALKKLKEDLI